MPGSCASAELHCKSVRICHSALAVAPAQLDNSRRASRLRRDRAVAVLTESAHDCDNRPSGGRMTFPDDVIKPETPSVDHAGSVLCRLLVAHPEVVGIEILGQAEMSDGIITYSFAVRLPGGRELLYAVG